MSDQTPAPGEPFEVVFRGAQVGETYTLTITSDPASIPNSAIQIAGTASLAKTATSTTVAYTVTLSSAGTYRLALTDSSGALIADSTVTVRSAGSGAAATTGGGLAVTGTDPAVIGLTAGAVILLGAGVAYAVRRRQNAADR